MDQVVQAPVSLLLDPDLTAAEKVLWAVSRLRPDGAPGWLAATSGLSRATVFRALPRVRHMEHGSGPAVAIPVALLSDAHLSATAKVLYGLLLQTPGFSHPSGHFAYAELAALARISHTTATKCVTELVEAEWLKISREHRLARVEFDLTFPGFEAGLTLLAAAQSRLNVADPYGEGLMQEYLSLLIDSDNYVEGGKAGALKNPRTDALLQLDRFYPPKVGFEFNGPQHYRKTRRYSAEKVKQQQDRDFIKLGICLTKGIHLVIVHPEDLTLEGMRQKVGNLLPLRDLGGCALLIDYLESESRAYRESIKHI